MLMSHNEEATKHLETSKQLAFVFQEEVRVHEDLMGLAFSCHGTNNQQACKVPSITAMGLEEELHIQDQWRDHRGSKSGQKWQLAYAYQEELWVHEDLIGLAFSSHGTNSAAIEVAVTVTMAAILREALPAVPDSQLLLQLHLCADSQIRQNLPGKEEAKQQVSHFKENRTSMSKEEQTPSKCFQATA